MVFSELTKRPGELDAQLQELQNQAVEQGMNVRLKVAGSDEDLARAKELDDAAFGPHHGISIEELRQIYEHGAVIMVEDEAGKVVGESQIIFEQIPELGRYQLQEDEAYAYGTAVDPKEQGHGIGRWANEAQKALARGAGKDTLVGSVRIENYSSLRMRMKNGFKITGFDSEFYGAMEEGGARAIIKSPTESISLSDADMNYDVTKLSEFDGQNTDEEALVVTVTFGDTVDLEANKKIDSLVKAGYEGVWIVREELKPNTGKDQKGHIVFKRKNTQPIAPGGDG